MKKQIPSIVFWSALLLAASSLSVLAQGIRVQDVTFGQGVTSQTIKGSITGDHTVDYRVHAQAGQVLKVTLQTNNNANYFNVLPPGSEEAIFIGSSEGNKFGGTLSVKGNYLIRVYLMRSAARRNEKADYSLMVSLNGSAAQGDAKVPGTHYHATGKVPCAMVTGIEPNLQCPFGVVRKGQGTADVTVTKPDGRTRTIFFKNGQAIGYDESQADPGEFRAVKKGDTTVVHIGSERYFIPDAVVSGG
jgi:hypothetical protein